MWKTISYSWQLSLSCQQLFGNLQLDVTCNISGPISNETFSRIRFVDTHLPGIYHHGKPCNQCLRAGKNLKILLGANHTTKLSFPRFFYANVELKLDITGPLNTFWGTKKYVLLCIDRFTNFPSKIVSKNTTSNSVISFVNGNCHLHGFPRNFRVDQESCFLSPDSNFFCEKINNEIIWSTIRNHSSIGKTCICCEI